MIHGYSRTDNEQPGARGYEGGRQRRGGRCGGGVKDGEPRTQPWRARLRLRGGSAFPALLCSWVRPSASVRRCAMRLRPLSPRNDWLPWASSLSPAAGAGMWSHWPVSPWGPRNGETEGPGSRRGRIRLEGSSPDRSRGRQVHSRLPSPLRSETSASQLLSAHGADTASHLWWPLLHRSVSSLRW